MIKINHIFQIDDSEYYQRWLGISNSNEWFMFLLEKPRVHRDAQSIRIDKSIQLWEKFVNIFDLSSDKVMPMDYFWLRGLLLSYGFDLPQNVDKEPTLTWGQ